MGFSNLQRLILIGVLVIQPWFWQLISANLLLTLLLLVLALLLTFKQRWSFILLIILSLGIFFWQATSSFDRELFVVTTHDVIALNRQRSAFPNGIGKFFINKPIFIGQKIARNLSFNLDPNLLFFASHPRERGGISEQLRFYPILLPFFLFGIYLVCQKRFKRLFLYSLLIVVLSTFIIPSRPLGPILLFPLCSFLISLGIYQSARLLFKLKR